MADGKSSGLASGTNGAPQLSLENEELENISKKIEIDFYGGKSGKLLPAKYKNWIGVNQRSNFLNKVKNPKLKNAVSELYRPGSFIGDGGTASVIKFEKSTGLGLGKNGNNHTQKGWDMVRYLENKVLTQNLSASDRKIAERLVKKLKQALGGK